MAMKGAHTGLLAAVLAVAFLPLVGSWWTWHGLPPMFGHFPPNVSGMAKPPFNWLYFLAGALVAALVTSFILFPRLFGFRQRGARIRPQHGKLPWWFWLGLITMLASWYLHWFGTSSIVVYTFMPLWCGLIVALDGAVFLRTGGRSLLATETHRFIVIAVVSSPVWAFFEYLNFYAVEFWIYPRDHLFSPTGQTIWYLVSFSVVLPAIFEWYTFLHTFDGLWNRWSRGPAIAIPVRATGSIATIGGCALVLFGALPAPLFPLLWLAPPLVLMAALATFRFWTPLVPVAHGNWSPAVLVGLASLANGILWELWNFGSEYWRVPGQSLNPNYWIYEIPYVDRFHPFSRMPILGYFGYLPFGVLAWSCWLVVAHLFDLVPTFDITLSNQRAAERPGTSAHFSTNSSTPVQDSSGGNR